MVVLGFCFVMVWVFLVGCFFGLFFSLCTPETPAIAFLSTVFTQHSHFSPVVLFIGRFRSMSGNHFAYTKAAITPNQLEAAWIKLAQY